MEAENAGRNEVRHYRFEVDVANSSTGLPTSDSVIANLRTLLITVTVNGQQLCARYAMDDQLPFETQLQYFTRAAVENLHALMRERSVPA